MLMCHFWIKCMRTLGGDKNKDNDLYTWEFLSAKDKWIVSKKKIFNHVNNLILNNSRYHGSACSQ